MLLAGNAELTSGLVRLDHVAGLIVNANHGIVRSAEKLCVIDGVAARVRSPRAVISVGGTDGIGEEVGRTRSMRMCSDAGWPSGLRHFDTPFSSLMLIQV